MKIINDKNQVTMGLDRADCLHLIFCRQAPVITVDNALDEFLRKPHRTNFHTLAIKKIFQKIVSSKSESAEKIKRLAV